MNPAVTARVVYDGGVFLGPIFGDMLATASQQTQVRVFQVLHLFAVKANWFNFRGSFFFFWIASTAFPKYYENVIALQAIMVFINIDAIIVVQKTEDPYK